MHVRLFVRVGSADEIANCRVAASLLQKLGVRSPNIIQLFSGEAVLAHFASPGHIVPHVMLMDNIMKGLTGVAVMQRLQCAFPVVAMSGNVDESSVSGFQGAGFCALLAKPFNIRDLRACLLHALTTPSGWLNTCSASK